MKATIYYNGLQLTVNLHEPIDISIPLKSGKDNITAWYVNPPLFRPVISDKFIGDVNLGGAVNFRDIYFNPHGHGTHTECVGHISKEFKTINQTLKQFFFIAQLITVKPITENNNRIITIKEAINKLNPSVEALIIRTLPNTTDKCSFQYSNTNPPYLEEGSGKLLRNAGIKHLLLDTPSVDKEFDNGILHNHHEFWDYPNTLDENRTITELIYVPDIITDGLYLLNLQIAPFENDATPSKPILYKITEYII
jgi:kynurenine formamidase